MLQKIEADLKTALLARDQFKVDVLKGLKNTIRNEEINTRKELSDDEAMKLIAKESKKRLDAAKLYKDAGEEERAQRELDENEIIKQYLPEQLSEQELEKLVDEVIEEVGKDNMGRVIGEVNRRAKGRANGGDIARIVKGKL